MKMILNKLTLQDTYQFDLSLLAITKPSITQTSIKRIIFQLLKLNFYSFCCKESLTCFWDIPYIRFNFFSRSFNLLFNLLDNSFSFFSYFSRFWNWDISILFVIEIVLYDSIIDWNTFVDDFWTRERGYGFSLIWRLEIECSLLLFYICGSYTGDSVSLIETLLVGRSPVLILI